MNNDRRRALEKAIELLNQAQEIVSSVLDEEQESYDNLPEGFQQSERGETMEDIISDLECIDIEEICDSLQDIIDR